MATVDASATNPARHTAVVLFYKYFVTSQFPIFHQYASYFEEQLLQWIKALATRLSLKGRVLLSVEGINGTVSATSMDIIDTFIQEMEDFQLVKQLGLPPLGAAAVECPDERLFDQVDWKISCCDSSHLPEPFPDLKVSIVKEIISSGGGVTVDEIPKQGGQHLTPQEFHQTLTDDKDVVVIDVRNTFECEIGHFVNPHTNQPAIDPGIVKFSMFDDTFCAKQAESLKDKKVLMYCTGGIRCEKASVMLKRRGVKDVFQLKGGIHRYLEEFGDQGYFRGLNFVFDQRVAMTPLECQSTNANVVDRSVHDIVGQCVHCHTRYDELCGSRICTVCRDPLLVCPACQTQLREYHCRRHQAWKSCYFTFLEVFDRDQLVQQRTDLLALRDGLVNRNIRRTLMRQVEKVDGRIKDLDAGVATVDPKAPRRCRTCMEPNSICDGKCWGFWRVSNNHGESPNDSAMILPVQLGDVVEPGPNWNAQRLGTPVKDAGGARCGKVVEIKSWGSGGNDLDSVVVQWDEDSIPVNRRSDRVPQIYRWGVVALDGSRLYDVQKKLDH